MNRKHYYNLYSKQDVDFLLTFVRMLTQIQSDFNNEEVFSFHYEIIEQVLLEKGAKRSDLESLYQSKILE